MYQNNKENTDAFIAIEGARSFEEEDGRELFHSFKQPLTTTGFPSSGDLSFKEDATAGIKTDIIRKQSEKQLMKENERNSHMSPSALYSSFRNSLSDHLSRKPYVSNPHHSHNNDLTLVKKKETQMNENDAPISMESAFRSSFVLKGCLPKVNKPETYMPSPRMTAGPSVVAATGEGENWFPSTVHTSHPLLTPIQRNDLLHLVALQPESLIGYQVCTICYDFIWCYLKHIFVTIGLIYRLKLMKGVIWVIIQLLRGSMICGEIFNIN